MNIFYCDIEGTITSGDIKLLVECLEKIMEKDNLNKLYLSFVTTVSISELNVYINGIIPYLKDRKIVLGTQFCDKYQIDKNGNVSKHNFIAKAEQINSDIKDKDINFMYYADDQVMNIVMISALMNVERPKVMFTTFIPGKFLKEDNSYGSTKRELPGLVDAINSFCLTKKI